MSSSKMIIGREINYQRKQKGFTLKELADKLDTDRQYVWRLENGKVNITADYLDKVIESLGCRQEDFLNQNHKKIFR